MFIDFGSIVIKQKQSVYENKSGTAKICMSDGSSGRLAKYFYLKKLMLQKIQGKKNT